MADAVIQFGPRRVVVQRKGGAGPVGGTAPVDTDGTLAADSDGVVPSQKAVKTYVDDAVAGASGGDLLSTNNLSDLASVPTARANLGLVIGTNVQAQDAELAAIAGLTSAANKLPYFTGSGTAALADLTSAGRALIDDADAASQRTTLGLGTIATEDEATAAQIQAGTASKAVAADKLLASAAPQTLTDGATISWDMAAGYNAKVTLGGNRTLGTPTNPKAGMTYSLAVIQDGTGSRTMTWPSAFDWGTTGAPTLTTTASKRDRITLFCTDAVTPKFDAFLSGKGFS